MPEIENQEAVLQNFIMEIKKVKESFPSLFAVENVNDLGLEESGVWEEYKMLFKKTEQELSKFDPQRNEVLDSLIAEARVLVNLIHKNTLGIKNDNRLEFFAWIKNRLGVLVSNLEFLQSEGIDTLPEVKEELSQEKKKLLF